MSGKTQTNVDSMAIAAEITKERCDQVAHNGWSREHDDMHDKGELAEAAAAYAIISTQQEGANEIAADLWPLEWYGMEPKEDRRRNLVTAAALIVAEIERLDRAALSQGEQPK